MIAFAGLVPRTAHASALVLASEPSDLVAVVGDADSELTRRIAAELELIGFHSRIVAPPPDPDPRRLESLSRGLHAAAAIYIDTGQAQLELWVVDRMTGKTLLRRISLEEEPRVVAVHAVELLRAGLLELDRNPEPVAAEVSPPPQVRTLLRPESPRFGLSLAAAIAWAPGGLSPAGQLHAAFRFMPHPRIGLFAGAVAPMVASRIRADEGEAEVRAGWFIVGPRLGFGRPRGTVHGDLALGLGPAFFGMTGAPGPTPGYESRRDLVVTAVAELSAALEINLTARLRFRLGASAGICMPVPRVNFGNRRVTQWCLPYAAGSLGLAYVW